MSEEGIVESAPVEAEVVSHEPVTDALQEDQQSADAPQEEAKKDEPIPKGVQKRIDRAVRQKYEAEARAKMLEERLSYLERQTLPQQPKQQPIDNSEPKIENFDNFDAYVAAKAEYIAAKKIEQTLSEREQRQNAAREQAERQKTAENWQRQVAKATAEMPDFEDVIASSDVPMTPYMEQAIKESDIGPNMAYYLAKNPDEASKIAGMSPIRAIAALGRIEERLANQQPTRVATSAPPPVSTVGSKASAAKDPDKMSTDEWLAWRNKQLKAKSA